MPSSSLTVSAWILVILAVALAWPVPLWLSRAQWVQRSPLSAMILWQSIGLAGGLSMIGAFLTWGLVPLGDTLYQAAIEFWKILTLSAAMPSNFDVWRVFALAVAALLGGHLVFTLALTFVRIRRARSRHRDLLLVLFRPAHDREDTVVVNYAAPVAYCIPGGSRSVTVLSEGLLNMLTAEELRGVLIHEKTHLAQRHHLLLWAFAAWRSALPWLPTTRLAQVAVSELIEMLADDVALRAVPRSALVRALALVAGSDRDETELGQEHQSTLTPARINRLLHQPTPLPLPQIAAIWVAAALLLTIPTAILLVPGL